MNNISSDPKTLQDLWEIKEEAYKEVSDLPTLKDKILKRIQNSSESSKKIKDLQAH
jgi:hypothetical protein